MDKDVMRKRCEALLTALVGKDLVGDWWNSPNKAFANETPEQTYSVAPTTVYTYLMHNAEGGW